MRNAAVKQLYKLAELDKDIVLLTGDLGYGVLDQFCGDFPGQFINAGISEQNMASVAAGMAIEGKIVFTYSVANFPTLRCLEQIRNDIAYHNANVKIIAVGCGLAYGSLGMSHQATEDIAAMRSLPNMTVFAPGDLTEAEWAIRTAYKTEGPCYIRLGKGGEPRIHPSDNEVQFGNAIQIFDGCELCIFSTGGILDEAYRATVELNNQDISTALFSFPVVKPIDVETTCDCAKRFDLIITLEEHNINGGFGGAVSEVMAEMPQKKAFLKRIAINDTYCSVVGNQKYLRESYGISANSVINTAKAMIASNL